MAPRQIAGEETRCRPKEGCAASDNHPAARDTSRARVELDAVGNAVGVRGQVGLGKTMCGLLSPSSSVICLPQGALYWP